MDARMDCLDDAFVAVETLIEVLADADAEVVLRSGALFDDLPDPQGCRQVLPRPTADTVPVQYEDDVAQARRDATSARTLLRAGRPQDAARTIERGLEHLGDHEFGPRIRAELLRSRATLQRSELRDDSARATLREAIGLARTASDPRLEAESWIALLSMEGHRRVEDGSGLAYRFAAEVALSQLDDARSLWADLDLETGMMFSQQGRAAKALPYLEQALASIRDQAPDSRAEARVHTALGMALGELGRHAESLARFEHAYAVDRAVVDGKHPDLIVDLANLAQAHSRLGDEAAATRYRDASELAVEVLGPDHPRVAAMLVNEANYLHLEQPDVALEKARQAERILSARDGVMPVALSRALEIQANVLVARGEFDRGLELNARSVALMTEAVGTEHRSAVPPLWTRARHLEQAGRRREAIETLLQVREIFEAIEGPPGVEYALVLRDLGEVLSREGRHEEALATLRDAVDTLERVQVDPRMVCEAELIHAKAQWGSGQRRDEALEMARDALACLQALPRTAHSDQSIANFKDWLEAPDRASLQ